jgi:hypothetical protein
MNFELQGNAHSGAIEKTAVLRAVCYGSGEILGLISPHPLAAGLMDRFPPQTQPRTSGCGVFNPTKGAARNIGKSQV